MVFRAEARAAQLGRHGNMQNSWYSVFLLTVKQPHGNGTKSVFTTITLIETIE
jgi:hypothetical protein